MAISKVVQFINSPEYAHFSRIVFDTAPTGHTLRLLTLPDFLDASLGARSLFGPQPRCRRTYVSMCVMRCKMHGVPSLLATV